MEGRANHKHVWKHSGDRTSEQFQQRVPELAGHFSEVIDSLYTRPESLTHIVRARDVRPSSNRAIDHQRRLHDCNFTDENLLDLHDAR